MAFKFLGSVLSTFMPPLIKSGFSGTQILTSYRTLGLKIPNNIFWKYHRQAKNIVKMTGLNEGRSWASKVQQNEFVLQAFPTGARYKYRFEAKVLNPLNNRKETRYFTAISNRNVSPKTAWGYLQDELKTGDSSYDLQIQDVKFLVGLKRQEIRIRKK